MSQPNKYDTQADYIAEHFTVLEEIYGEEAVMIGFGRWAKQLPTTDVKEKVDLNCRVGNKHLFTERG